LGPAGGSLGYETITNSAALAINIYPPNTTGGVGSGIKVLTNGQPPAGGFFPIAPVDPGLVNTPTDVDVTYDGVNASVTFNQNGNTFSSGPIPLDIGGTAGTSALLGFTGATGGLQAQQQISNFSFSTLPLNIYANDVSVAAGSSPTINVAATASVFNVTMGALTLGANSTLNVGADASTPVDQAFGLRFGATTLNGASTINVGVNGAGFGTVTLGAVGGPGSLTKTGAGVLVLPSAGTYTGPTNVNGGRLIVTNTSGSATGAGPVNVNSGGTLGGTGFITGNIQVNSGGTIEPGSPLFPAVAPGILNVANVTFTGGALRVKLNGNTPGTGHDQLLSTGTVSIGTNVASLNTSLGYAPSGADQLVIVQAAAVSPGQFIGLPNNQVFAVGFFGAQQYSAQIHYTSNQIFLNSFTPVPEPVHMLLVGGVAGLAWRWRKRRAK
jgi:autotransporter-associated beta strand protein